MAISVSLASLLITWLLFQVNNLLGILFGLFSLLLLYALKSLFEESEAIESGVTFTSSGKTAIGLGSLFGGAISCYFAFALVPQIPLIEEGDLLVWQLVAASAFAAVGSLHSIGLIERVLHAKRWGIVAVKHQS